MISIFKIIACLLLLTLALSAFGTGLTIFIDSWKRLVNSGEFSFNLTGLAIGSLFILLSLLIIMFIYWIFKQRDFL